MRSATSARAARVDQSHSIVCAMLLVEACNITLSEVAQPSLPALSRNRLSWVSQNYVRAETIAAANERLLAINRRIPLVQVLGDGHIATVDGMRFRVPVPSIHTDPNPAATPPKPPDRYPSATSPRAAERLTTRRSVRGPTPRHG